LRRPQLERFRRRAGRALAHGLTADAEILAGPAQDHDFGALARAEQELRQFDPHGVGGGVSDLRAIERDFQHRPLAGGENVAGHAFSSQSVFRPVRRSNVSISESGLRCQTPNSNPSPADVGFTRSL